MGLQSLKTSKFSYYTWNKIQTSAFGMSNKVLYVYNMCNHPSNFILHCCLLFFLNSCHAGSLYISGKHQSFSTSEPLLQLFIFWFLFYPSVINLNVICSEKIFLTPPDVKSSLLLHLIILLDSIYLSLQLYNMCVYF